MSKTKKIRAATEYAIECMRETHGNYETIAEVLGTTIHNVRVWKFRGWIPPKHVLRVSEESGVSVHDLSPDIFGPPPEPVGNGRRTAEASSMHAA